MDKMLEKAKKTLNENDFTCILLDEKQIRTSKKSGIIPLLEWYNESEDYSSCYAADKVVGKGAAFLYVLLNVKNVYCAIISKDAKRVFEKYNISFCFEKEVDKIKNRDNTGLCPIESALTETEDAKKALPVITETLEKIKSGYFV